MSEITPYFPSWLSEAIVEDRLSWELGRTWSFAEFSEIYTLHDSSWISLNAHVRHENSAVLAFLWDAAWIPDEVCKTPEFVYEWPFLFIKLESLEEIVTKDLDPLEYPREVGHAYVVEFENGLQTLVVSGDGGDIEVSFRGRMIFLGLDREKQVLAI